MPGGNPGRGRPGMRSADAANEPEPDDPSTDLYWGVQAHPDAEGKVVFQRPEGPAQRDHPDLPARRGDLAQDEAPRRRAAEVLGWRPAGPRTRRGRPGGDPDLLPGAHGRGDCDGRGRAGPRGHAGRREFHRTQRRELRRQLRATGRRPLPEPMPDARPRLRGHGRGARISLDQGPRDQAPGGRACGGPPDVAGDAGRGEGRRPGARGRRSGPRRTTVPPGGLSGKIRPARPLEHVGAAQTRATCRSSR